MNVPPQSEVVGTDISAASLQQARAGIYTRWSSRESAPPLFPVHAPMGKDRLKVLDEVAAITRFAEHNLLEPLRQHLGEFQIIFCRNVLAYFSAPAGRIAVANLCDALGEGGYIFFGAMDVDRTPAGLEEVPSRGLQIFRRPLPSEKRQPPPVGERKRKSGSRKAEPQEPTNDKRKEQKEQVQSWVDAHVHALAQIEHGQRHQAEKELSELRRRAPSYLPGLLELALLDLRNGRRGSAEELMREILRRSEDRPPDEDCPGPEVLPVSYYRTAAQALLAGPGGGGGEG
jgi:chemotaxis protein methyltransferase CheR